MGLNVFLQHLLISTPADLQTTSDAESAWTRTETKINKISLNIIHVYTDGTVDSSSMLDLSKTYPAAVNADKSNQSNSLLYNGSVALLCA